MSLPIWTTTGAVVRYVRTSGQDLARASTPAATTVVPAGTGAVLSSASGREGERAGQQEAVDALLYLDTETDLQQRDIWTDATTGLTWAVVWSERKVGFGLAHTVAGVARARGVNG